MPLSEDKVSLGDEEFIVPEDPVEQERFKRRLIATAKSLKKSNNTASNPGTSEARDSNGKPCRNRYKHRNNGDNAKDTTVNARFSGSKSGQRKKAVQKKQSGPVQPTTPTENDGCSNRPAS